MDKDLGSFINDLLWKAQGFKTSLNPRVAAGIMHSALGYAGATENAQTAAAAHRYGADVGLAGEQLRGATDIRRTSIQEKARSESEKRRLRVMQAGDAALRMMLEQEQELYKPGDLNAALGGGQAGEEHPPDSAPGNYEEDPEEDRVNDLARSSMLNKRFEELRRNVKKNDTLLNASGSSVRVPLGISAFQKLYDWTR